MSQYPPNPYEQRPNDPNAGSGTSYGNPPSGGQNPYPGNPSSGPGSNPGQYGAYPPPPPAPNTDYNPYDPYAPTYANPNPNAAYGAYQQPTYQAPPPVYQPAPVQQPAPRRKGPSTLLIVLVVVALIIIAGGILGAFIYTNGKNSNAAATATAQNATATANANATATANTALTATAVASTFPFSSNQVLNDPLSDNTGSAGWQTGSGCMFSGSAYHVIDTQSNTFETCFGTNTNYSNFTFQVEMVVTKGDGGGLLFRANDKTNQFYRLTFYTDGTYGLYVYVDNTGTNARILKSGSYASSPDLTSTHTIAVVARDGMFTIYYDQQMITSITDSTYTSGEIGFTSSFVNNAAEAVFTNAMVWQLS